MTALRDKSAPVAGNAEHVRLAKEDVAAWESYGEAVHLGLSSKLRRSRFALAMATTRRLADYELTQDAKVGDGSS